MVLLLPAYALYRTAGVISALSAVGACLAAGLLAIAVLWRTSRQKQAVFGLLLAMSLRISLVLASALAVCILFPAIRESGFLWWLSAAYFVSLFAETRMLLAANDSFVPPPRAATLQQHL